MLPATANWPARVFFGHLIDFQLISQGCGQDLPCLRPSRRRPRSGPPLQPEPPSRAASRAEALDFLRSLRGLRFSGYDVVEVSRPMKAPVRRTAIAAANVAYEFLTLDVLGH